MFRSRRAEGAMATPHVRGSLGLIAATGQDVLRVLATFEAANRPLPARVYETRSSAAVRASGLAERRYTMAA